MATTTLFSTPSISYFFVTLVVLLQLHCEARNLQERKNYVTLPSHAILSKVATTPTPAPASAPATSYISSTPTSAPAPAPADDYANLYNYKMTSQYPTLDNEDGEEDFSNVQTNGFNSDSGGDDDDDDDDVHNALWPSNYRGYKSRSQPHGMSDTRLPANANLYNNNYNLYTENENAQLQHDDGNYTPTSSGNQVVPLSQGYYYTDRPKSRFEFDSMEEYEKQEGYP